VGGNGRKTTIFTSSEDRFVKIYSLLGGSLLLSVAFPQPISALLVDVTEQQMFVGGVDGSIYIYGGIRAPPRRGIEAQISHDGVLKKHGKR
jgi:hypothetical protein